MNPKQNTLSSPSSGTGLGTEKLKVQDAIRAEKERLSESKPSSKGKTTLDPECYIRSLTKSHCADNELSSKNNVKVIIKNKQQYGWISLSSPIKLNRQEQRLYLAMLREEIQNLAPNMLIEFVEMEVPKEASEDINFCVKFDKEREQLTLLKNIYTIESNSGNISFQCTLLRELNENPNFNTWHKNQFVGVRAYFNKKGAFESMYEILGGSKGADKGKEIQFADPMLIPKNTTDDSGDTRAARLNNEGALSPISDEIKQYINTLVDERFTALNNAEIENKNNYITEKKLIQELKDITVIISQRIKEQVDAVEKKTKDKFTLNEASNQAWAQRVNEQLNTVIDGLKEEIEKLDTKITGFTSFLADLEPVIPNLPNMAIHIDNVAASLQETQDLIHNQDGQLDDRFRGLGIQWENRFGTLEANLGNYMDRRMETMETTIREKIQRIEVSKMDRDEMLNIREEILNTVQNIDEDAMGDLVDMKVEAAKKEVHEAIQNEVIEGFKDQQLDIEGLRTDVLAHAGKISDLEGEINTVKGISEAVVMKLQQEFDDMK